MRSVSLLLLLLVPFARLLAQPPADPTLPEGAEAPPLKRIIAERIAGEIPVVDGRLDEQVWKAGPVVTDFLEKEPSFRAVPTERTEVRFRYDDNAIYIGAHMYCERPEDIRAFISRRDNSWSSERFIVSLDTYRDRRTAYSFSITASGVRTDYYHGEDGEFPREYSYDPVWEAKAAIDSTGWTAEMRIPFSQLRFNDRDAQVWGVNMDRYIPHKNEDIYWIPVPNTETGWASRMGDLVGISGIKPALRLELLPYAAASATLHSRRDAADPFDNGSNLVGRGGLDLKMGLGPHITLNGTVNPDFGQVEADPAQVNLSAFESVFDERRPFFVEGSNVLSSPVNYFYSRRIGAVPHGSAGGDYVDFPSNTTILGAAKISGRMESGLSVGGLAAVTGRETARSYDVASSRYDTTEVEPPTAYAVARVQQELDHVGSVAGGMVTMVHRQMEKGSASANLLARDAITGGADWSIMLDDGVYNVYGRFGGSLVMGDTAAMQRVQQSSAHYFQRPDAAVVRYDPKRTSLAGYTAGLGVKRRSGEHWTWVAGVGVESPGLELNDVGRISSADDINIDGEITYRETQPSGIFHNYSVTGGTYGALNFDGNSPGTSFALYGNATFENFWSANAYVGYGTPGMSDDLTRGGPLAGVAWNVDANASISSDYSSPNQVSLGGNWGTNGLGAYYYGVWTSIAAAIGDQISLSLSPSYNVSTAPRQYIGTFDGGRSETYGKRYVFGHIDQTTISAQLRASYAVTPNMTLDAYGELFTASGGYDRYGELAAPRTLELRRYGTDGTGITDGPDGDFLVTDGPSTFSFSDPNFRFSSFRSNLVFRWEWRPGSTLYLVWQQDRELFEGKGTRVGPGDLFSPITAGGVNFLVLKLTYWIPAG